MKFWSKKNNVQKYKFINVEIINGAALFTNCFLCHKGGFQKYGHMQGSFVTAQLQDQYLAYNYYIYVIHSAVLPTYNNEHNIKNTTCKQSYLISKFIK